MLAAAVGAGQAPIHGILSRGSFTLNLDAIKAHLAKKHPEMTPEILEVGESEYRNFLQRCKENSNENVVPGKLADKFWHAHILHTKVYVEHCQNFFGYYLHHTPKPALSDEVYKDGECFCEGDGGGFVANDLFTKTDSCG